MLIPFKSKAAADFFMLQTHAAPLFELMGKAMTPQGVISATELASCLSLLQQGLQAQAISKSQPTNECDNLTHEQANLEQSVGLKQRAWPLLDMLERAHRQQVDVLWGVRS